MVIIAKKNNNRDIIFELPDKTEPEALKYAKDSIRKTIRQNFNKRMWGWKFKVK